MSDDPLDIVFSYHERTKHHLQRHARSLGYMDWATQPDPFRRYDGAQRIALEHVPPAVEPLLDRLGDPTFLPAQMVNRETISQLFFDSLALSAWKQAGASRWALRVNPSSGNLHPTEGYVIADAIEGLGETPAVYHYAPSEHCLEQRRVLSADTWRSLTEGLPTDVLLLGLTSIYWRESWKYGERAFRYCQHDVGHAIAAVAYAASTLGWRTRLLESVNDGDLALLLGVHDQSGPEAEHPDCLLVVSPNSDQTAVTADPAIQPGPNAAVPVVLPADVRSALRDAPPHGDANTLSDRHHPWPVIDQVSDATCRSGDANPPLRATSCEPPTTPPAEYSVRPISARQVIRQRRSAVDMDGTTSIPRDAFYHALTKVSPEMNGVPFSTLPWEPAVHLALFVHRVDDLSSGLYVLARRHNVIEALRTAMSKDEFLWQRPPGCPDGLDLFLLVKGNTRDAARTVSCHQDIASDGVFAVGMLAEFESRLTENGPWFYKRLFWETGMIGQVLYLEAEAMGIRGTGIGCFFDDAMHGLLGMRGRAHQSLYHFTVGGPLDDSRLKTLRPYEHLGVD